MIENNQMNNRHSASIDCTNNPTGSLVEMFVKTVQAQRIAQGQCPALRPVFLKPHGVAHGIFRIFEHLPEHLKVGLFAGSEYPAWVRFSSDTLTTISDWTTTIGIGIKLFGTPTPKIFSQPDETTFDFIFQNMDVFFVDSAKDMCEFTQAGVIEHDYANYLKAHPTTARILEEMKKKVGSVLASPYWAILPFAFGPDRYVKYKLEPMINVPEPTEAPVNPTYLAADLEARLKANQARFIFKVQLRTDAESMPLDAATVRWPEAKSPFIPVAELILPQQDITSRGQTEYGENLAYNIWRVTADHAPQGSIAEARKVVYAASAAQRRNVNGVPVGEPAEPRPPIDPAPCVDNKIVRAAIHPAIGIARVGDSEDGFFIGPEVAHPPSQGTEFYRDHQQALKRQAARFRIYGYNAAGEVVCELNNDNADIKWTVHIANRKACWYRFVTAMDIPESVDLTVPLRNKTLQGKNRETLVIDPGPRSISGADAGGESEHAFDTGMFKGEKVPLGELRTDAAGRLIFLGGHGKSDSPSGAPPFDPSDPNSFNNANDWYDDMSDGPVDAHVSIKGRNLPVEGAWIVTAPPNYAPNVISWRTMYDLLTDVFIANGWIPMPAKTSFTTDVLPLLARMSNLQWVNKGFAAMFGAGGPMDFENLDFIAKLASGPNPKSGADPWRELRLQIANTFRPSNTTQSEPRLWPWIYGDDFDGELYGASPRIMLQTPSVQEIHLQRWANGIFTADWTPDTKPPKALNEVPLADQPAMLDRAALDHCLADAFHPGCELTWPMRHPTLYTAPLRIRRRSGELEPNYGPQLSQKTALGPTGPLHGQGPGDLTRWMGLPWQGDTAYCRSGYDPAFDPYLPTFWPARVPNQVLTEDDYRIVIDTSRPRAERLASFNRRASWYRFIDEAPDIPARMMRMVAHFGAQGIVEARPGVTNDPNFPPVIYVECLPESQIEAMRLAAVQATEETKATEPMTGSLAERIREAGWGDEQHLEAARKLRARRI